MVVHAVLADGRAAVRRVRFSIEGHDLGWFTVEKWEDDRPVFVSEKLRRSECPRHGPQAVIPPDIPLPWVARRCSHYGSRFVVELHCAPLGYSHVDYVEDLPGGDVVVENHTVFGNQPMTDTVWDSLVAKMLAGVPPDSDILDVRR